MIIGIAVSVAFVFIAVVVVAVIYIVRKRRRSLNVSYKKVGHTFNISNMLLSILQSNIPFNLGTKCALHQVHYVRTFKITYN